MTIQYDPQSFTSGLGFLKALFSYQNTVIPAVLRSGLFWTNLFLHIVFQILARWGPRAGLSSGEGTDSSASSSVDDVSDDITTTSDIRRLQGTEVWEGMQIWTPPPSDALPYVDWRISVTTLTLLIFFLVFYTNTEHGRHNAFFMNTVVIGGCVQRWAALVKLHLPRVGHRKQNQESGDDSGEHSPVAVPHRHWNAVRFMLASMQIMYYSIHNAGVDDQEWSAMIERGLLGRNEAHTLQTYPGNQPWLCLVWAVVEVQTQLKVAALANGEANNMVAGLHMKSHEKQFHALAEELRAQYGQILHGRKLHVPFPYFHLLAVLIVFNLVMISYSSVTLAAWPLSFIANVFFSAMVLGMRTVAIMLSDPFGQDKVDLDVEPLMRSAYEEVTSQLRMRAHVPLLDELPAGPSGNSIVDPLTCSVGQMPKWHMAEQTKVTVKGLSKLKRRTTQAIHFQSTASQAVRARFAVAPRMAPKVGAKGSAKFSAKGSAKGGAKGGAWCSDDRRGRAERTADEVITINGDAQCSDDHCGHAQLTADEAPGSRGPWCSKSNDRQGRAMLAADKEYTITEHSLA